MDRQAAAALGAELIFRGFDRFHDGFRAITRRALRRFEERHWSGIRRDTVERLNLHAASIGECFTELEPALGPDLDRRDLWVELKRAYARAILGRDDFEVAQTYFNSLVRKVFPHVGVDPEIDFVAGDFPLPYRGWEMASARSYVVREVDAGVVSRILQDAGLECDFRDLAADAELAAERIRAGIAESFGGAQIEALDVLRPVFVRNKAAYVIGRARCGEALMPLLLSILNPPGGLTVDAVLHTEEEASIVFSFARWYFHAEVENPREVIGFLHSILPRKRISELYISLGYNKHGKTEFYSDLIANIASADERFVVAPGQPGMVMSVFTLPSYEFVFKVIKDAFPAPKGITPGEVREKYRQVLLHDRVGRLVDFQEFEHLTFARSRFSGELLEELLRVASNTVRVAGEEVVVRHCYVGRRVTPLDLFLRQASPGEAASAVSDWGRTLKELAAADLFAGDLLLKNFGVTRHGRVVFYDYDEICALTDCNFRRLPPARTYDDELAAEPWFSVGESDVFPEEFRSFLSLDAALTELFTREHGDLFGVQFWRRLQELNRRGEVVDFFPYTSNRRLRPGPGDAVDLPAPGEVLASRKAAPALRGSPAARRSRSASRRRSAAS